MTRKSSSSVTKKLSWDEYFKLLSDYKAKHGDCLVPLDYGKDGLGFWVHRQRHYAVASRPLTKTQRKKLESLGGVLDEKQVEWDKQNRMWIESFLHLLQYREEHGDYGLNSSFVADDGTSLGKWVAKQRNRQRRELLDDERSRLLAEIDFSWDQDRPEHVLKQYKPLAWDEKFALLQDYTEQFGTSDVPLDYVDDANLAYWVYELKTHPEKLTAKQKKQLKSLDFNFALAAAPKPTKKTSKKNSSASSKKVTVKKKTSVGAKVKTKVKSKVTPKKSSVTQKDAMESSASPSPGTTRRRSITAPARYREEEEKEEPKPVRKSKPAKTSKPKATIRAAEVTDPDFVPVRKTYQDIGPHDVLMGRGGGTNYNDGNIRFREIIASKRAHYKKLVKFEKKAVAEECIDIVHRNGGRFFRDDTERHALGLVEVPRAKAVGKASQALREEVPFKCVVNEAPVPRAEVPTKETVEKSSRALREKEPVVKKVAAKESPAPPAKASLKKSVAQSSQALGEKLTTKEMVTVASQATRSKPSLNTKTTRSTLATWKQPKAAVPRTRHVVSTVRETPRNKAVTDTSLVTRQKPQIAATSDGRTHHHRVLNRQEVPPTKSASQSLQAPWEEPYHRQGGDDNIGADANGPDLHMDRVIADEERKHGGPLNDFQRSWIVTREVMNSLPKHSPPPRVLKEPLPPSKILPMHEAEKLESGYTTTEMTPGNADGSSKAATQSLRAPWGGPRHVYGTDKSIRHYQAHGSGGQQVPMNKAVSQSRQAPWDEPHYRYEAPKNLRFSPVKRLYIEERSETEDETSEEELPGSPERTEPFVWDIYHPPNQRKRFSLLPARHNLAPSNIPRAPVPPTTFATMTICDGALPWESSLPPGAIAPKEPTNTFRRRRLSPSQIFRGTREDDRQWVAMYEKMVRFLLTNGQCLVAPRDTAEEDRSLSKWATTQRQLFRQRKLDLVRKRLLDQIGFVWRPDNGTTSKSLSSQKKRSRVDEEEATGANKKVCHDNGGHKEAFIDLSDTYLTI